MRLRPGRRAVALPWETGWTTRLPPGNWDILTRGLRCPSNQTTHPLNHCQAALVQGNGACSPALVEAPNVRVPPPAPELQEGTGNPGEHPFKANGSFLSHSDFQLPPFTLSPTEAPPQWLGGLVGMAGPRGGAPCRGWGARMGHFLLPEQTPRRTPEIDFDRKLWEMNLFLP